MRASGVQIVKMQPMSADAMAKQLCHEDGWDAEAALRCAQVAQGDWRKLRTTAEIFCHDNELTGDADLVESSRKDATMSALHPSLAANQVLNGTADPGCAMDPTVFAWTERNLGLRCDSIEEMARKQELAALADVMQTDAIKCQEACHVGPELFALGARNPAKRVQHTFGLYANPWQKDAKAVALLEASYNRQRPTAFRVNEAALAQEREAAGCTQVAPPLAKRAKAKAKAKAATRPRAR